MTDTAPKVSITRDCLIAPINDMGAVYLKVTAPDGWEYGGMLRPGTVGAIEAWAEEHGFALRPYLPAAVDMYVSGHGNDPARLPDDLLRAAGMIPTHHQEHAA